MSKTISFVASDELAEYLEEEAERRMTTVSSTAQMLLAEQVSGGGGPQPETGRAGRDDPAPDVFERHPEVWYEPDSKQHNYVVYVPEDSDIYDAGKRRYYQTREGAAEAIKRWYE